MGGRLITLDTSGLFVLLNRRDPSHRRAQAALEADRGPYLVPAGMLGEAGYVIERRLGIQALDGFLEGLERGELTLDCGEGDVPRIRTLIRQYADLRLGFADAAVIACAERHGGRVLTFDRRDFDVVAGEGRLTVLP